MPSLIDWLNSIQSTGDDLMLTEEDEKDYVPFIINRGLAQGIDTIMLAEEVNRAPLMPKRNQYRFFMSTVKKNKRYNKWAKKDPVDERITIICEAFQVSEQKASEYMLILTEEQIEIMKEQLDVGGVKGRGRK